MSSNSIAALAPQKMAEQKKDVVVVKKPPIETASWCYRDKEEDVHHDFAWTITNFSRKINGVPNGEYIESDKFSVTAHGMDLEWQLCLYPAGKDGEDEEHVSILLELVSRSLTATFSGKIEFSVVSLNGDKVFRKKKSIKESDTQIGRPMFGLLAAKFIPHNLLRIDQQHNQITPEDRLTVLCEITIDGKDVQQSGKAQPEVKTSNKICPDKMSEDFGSLLETGQFSDITVTCEGVEISAHKVILAARSPVFNAMFNHNMRESETKALNIEDLDMDTVKDMLRYIYAGKIENLNTRSPRLLEAADKYQLSELKEICEEMLCSSLTVETCLECLVLADMHNAADLKAASVRFIVEHSIDFVDQIDKFKSYPDLMAELFKAMAKSPPCKRRK